MQKALAIIPDAELGNIVTQLDNERCEILMKYVYKIMAKPAEEKKAAEKSGDCATALKLQAALHERIGPGSVIRVLTDRKLV